MRIKTFFYQAVFIIALLFSPVVAFADHNDFHTIQQLQSQLASLQQAFAQLFAAGATPAQPSQGTGTAAQSAVPAKKAATSTVLTMPVIPAIPATPAQPYPGTGQPAQPAQQAIPPTPSRVGAPIDSIGATQPTTPQAELCSTCQQPTGAQPEEVIRSLQAQISEARGKVVQQLQNNIQLLQTQVAELQSKQRAISSSQEIIAPAPEVAFTRSLRRGLSGDDVKQLQGFLKQFPDVYPEGLKTGYFGLLTEAAVRRFQEKYGIETVGIVGPRTRVKLQDLISCGLSDQRQCYERETGGKTIRLNQTAGENAFSACMNNTSGSLRGESSEATAVCTDEIYHYCTEGQSGVVLKKFEGQCKAAPSVTVISPNGGEEIAQGYNRFTNQFIVDPAAHPYANAGYYDIKFSGGKGRFRIMLVKEAATNNTDPRNLIVGTFAYGTVGTIDYGTTYPSYSDLDMTLKSWEPTFSICIGQGDPWLSCDSMYITPGRYKILVLSENKYGELILWDESTNKPGNWDVSDEAFTVVPHSKITVVSPNGGETFLARSNAVINWEASGISSKKVSIALLRKDKGMVYFVATNVPLSSESGSFTYTWKVPDDVDTFNQQYNSNQYYVSVQEVLEGQSGGSYYTPTVTDIQATDLSDGSFTLAGPAPVIAPIPALSLSAAPKDIRAGWGITFHHSNKTSLYFHAINFAFADPLPLALRVYVRKPGENVFTRTSEFSNLPTVCGSLAASSNAWLIYRRCGDLSSWKIDSASLTSVGYPVGVYRMYLAAVDASGKESLSSEFEMANLSPLTVLAPTWVQSPVVSPPMFQWTTPSGWPQTSIGYTVQVYDSTTLPNPWIYTTSVTVPSTSTTVTHTYNGPALDPAKTYLARIYGLMRGISPICPSCDYISMDNATQAFSVKP